MIYNVSKRPRPNITVTRKRVNGFVLTLTAALLIGGIVVASCITGLVALNQINKHNECKQQMKNQQKLYEEMVKADRDVRLAELGLIADDNKDKRQQQTAETKYLVLAAIAIAVVLLMKKGK